MKIVILGAGQVGSSLAERLVLEENEITIIDTDQGRLQQLQNRIDLRAIHGDAASPSILRRAGLEDTDLLIAVTQSDQTNLVACQLARALFNVPTRIARLRSQDFVEGERQLARELFSVDFSICPEQIITNYIARLIDFPEALQVLDFAGGRVILVAVRAYPDGELVGKPVASMSEYLPLNMDARIAAIFRHDKPLEPKADAVIEAGDEVFVLAAAEHIRPVMRSLRRMEAPIRRIMIAGGGNIGLRLAGKLEADYNIKVIESQLRRAAYIATCLNTALVLHGEATDENLLIQEDVSSADFFLALTNSDESNIMIASLAKRLGCKHVLALINRRAYADMVQSGPIDIGLSPAQISIGTLLARIRRGDVVQVHSLHRGAAEALEIVAHGNSNTSKIIDRRIGDIDWPQGVTVAALVRDFDHIEVIQINDNGTTEKRLGRVQIAHDDTIIKENDHVILFCTDKKLVHKVENLFQVGLGFFS